MKKMSKIALGLALMSSLGLSTALFAGPQEKIQKAKNKQKEHTLWAQWWGEQINYEVADAKKAELEKTKSNTDDKQERKQLESDIREQESAKKQAQANQIGIKNQINAL